MFLSEKCIYAVHETSLSVKKVFRNVKFKQRYIPLRTFFFNNKSKEPASSNSSNKAAELKPLSGLDDENFSHNFKIVMSNPKLFKAGLINFCGEFKKFYNEECEKFQKSWNPRLDNRTGRVDMLYTFETREDLEKFAVNTDSSFNAGYSSASLKLTNENTALFSGNICTDVPKDGNVKMAGYANILSNKEFKAFFREKSYNWKEYTDLVFKIRGDGRTYMIILNLNTEYVEMKHMAYGQYLYTRGGPYWQIAKLQLAHFFGMTKGNLHTRQFEPEMLDKISRVGITAGSIDGPFKLEIDYIGLEYDDRYKQISPYEEYK